MVSIYQLKPRFQALLRPLVKTAAARGVTANQATLAAAFLSAAGGTALAAFAPERPALWLLLPALLFVRMALNAVDGMLAREHAMASSLGAMLNEMGDVVSDVALYLPFAWLPGASWPAAVAVCLLAVMSETAGVAAVQIGASRRYDGPMGKSDRAFVLGALGAAVGLGAPAGRFADPVLLATALLLALTVYQRVRNALREAAPHD